ncbi:MAG: sigma-54-dependent Fis family transcriptional regulator [Bdellovibrionales bacterium]|nr:sigma-54-dependent Fis family transcriptional regulator [Bdellovibrionales bacterium]
MPNQPTASSKIFSVLVADDDSNFRATLGRVLRRLDCEIVEAGDGLEAQRRMTEKIAVAVIDLEMPRATGRDFLAYAKKRFPDTPVIILSGRGNVSQIVRLMEDGAFWYLEKPFEPEELVALITRAWSHYELQKSNRMYRSGLRNSGLTPFVSSSPVMADLLLKIEKLCELDSTVLLTGETGTGKSSIARLIHQKSKRSEEPFVTINCAAVPRDLLESELFGHEKGAFTGAHAARAGSVEVADRGTLFLDEIGDLPLELQPKLLSFLQDGRYRRVGGAVEHIADARVIVATNRDLESMCRERLFREDLYFRVNVLSLQIPPLRSRREDILPLANQVLARIAASRHKGKYSLSTTAQSSMLAHEWPGNVRELENVLERATAFAEGSVLEEKDLGMTQPTPAPEASETRFISLDGLSLEEIEEIAIKNALQACKGNKTQVAKALGISQKSVYNKMLKFGL